MSIKNAIYKFKVDIIIIVIFILLSSIFSYNFAILNVSGNSMSPTYTDGQFILLKKHNVIETGDLIVFNAPEEWGTGNYKLLKRIVAQHNDEIIINQSEITINGVKEFHGKEYCNPSLPSNIILDKNEFLVAGDNKSNSNDGIYNYCIGNDEYKIKKDNAIVIGKSIYVLGGIKK